MSKYHQHIELLDRVDEFGFVMLLLMHRCHGNREVPKKRNAGRIYAAIVTAVLWLNAARSLTIFQRSDEFGAVVFLKLAVISGGFLSALLQAAGFKACQSGDLDGVIRRARLPKYDAARYRRLALVHTV